MIFLFVYLIGIFCSIICYCVWHKTGLKQHFGYVLLEAFLTSLIWPAEVIIIALEYYGYKQYKKYVKKRKHDK